MKNLLKIGALSLALIATVFMLNKTNAASGTVQLEITGASGYCVYGENIDFTQTGFSYDARTWETPFLNTGGTAEWFCEDKAGVASWAMSIQSSTVLNMTTNDAAHTIPATSVKISSATATLENGACDVNIGQSNGAFTPIDAAVTLLGKDGALGEACKVQTDSVAISVDLAPSQAVGVYSGNLTINVPSL